MYQIPETAKRFFDGPEGGSPYIQFINPRNKTDGVSLNIQNNGTAANLITWEKSRISETQVTTIGNSFTFDGDKINGIIAPNFIGNVTGDVTGDVTGNVNGHTGSFISSVTSPTLNGNVTGTTGSFTTSVTSPTFNGNVTGDVTGNASSASKLKTPINLAGNTWDGTQNISDVSVQDITVAGKMVWPQTL